MKVEVYGMQESEGVSPPWGNWSVLDDNVSFKVKRIEVMPGKRLSYQKHLKREEHWYIVKGQALITLEGEDYRIGEGESFDVGKDASHRIANVGDTVLVFIEIQRGEYFGEDDIVRLQDDYGRT
jgi:mannose-6-phosphate isomerase